MICVGADPRVRPGQAWGGQARGGQARGGQARGPARTEMYMKKIFKFWREIFNLRGMPKIFVDLMADKADGNELFYRQMVADYFAYTRKRHKKFPLIRHDQYGVALIKLPASFDEYFMSIEGAARRNYKKAKRLGYEFRIIEHNDFLEDISDIWKSTPIRQGEVPAHIREGRVTPMTHPVSKNEFHDYLYFGVLKDNKLYAYAGCMISGELCAIEHIYGHAGFQSDGVVPMLIIGIVREMIEHNIVNVVTYDTFLGASETLRRFKRKFGFKPYNVKWKL